MMNEEIIRLVTDLRRKLHHNAEASMKEIKTKQILLQFIEDNTQSLEIIDKDSWFYVVKRGQQAGIPIAFRADYDAVTCSDGCPRHLCGHDGHSAVLAGFALWLDGEIPEKDIYLIFQPGEEIGAGGAICASLMEEKQIGMIYGFHNIPGYKCGDVILLKHTFACASTGLEIEITGRQSHAAYPENGINPSGAMVEILQSIEDYVSKPHRGIVLSTVIGIEAGSDSYGVSAGEGTLRLTVRAEYQEEFDALLDHIEHVSEQSVRSIGAACKISRIEEFPATINDEACVQNIHAVADRMHFTTVYPDEPFRWSEDFGYYLQKTRGAYFGIGCGEDHPGLHTIDYEFEDAIIEVVLDLYKGLSRTE